MKTKYKQKDIISFLSESNKIEGVYDERSLKDAKEAWDFLSKQNNLSIKVILETHKILMQNQNLFPYEKGFFRKVSVRVRGQIGLEWSKIPDAIVEWIKDVETSLKIPGKNGENIKRDHITYEKIHPFVDSNGRTGRMFMNWERIQAGLPILIIHADYPRVDGEQIEYYSWFH